MEEHLQENAEKIQGVYRKHQARKKLATLKAQDTAVKAAVVRNEKADKIQGVVRQRQARKKLATLKDENNEIEEEIKEKKLRRVLKRMEANKDESLYGKALQILPLVAGV